MLARAPSIRRELRSQYNARAARTAPGSFASRCAECSFPIWWTSRRLVRAPTVHERSSMVDGGRERPSGIGGVTFGNAAAFWVGVALVTGGVIAHLPMYLMGKDMGYRLAGMPMETSMKVGMAAILVGLVVSLYGLLPRTAPTNAALVSRLPVSAVDDAPLPPAHWGLGAT